MANIGYKLSSEEFGPVELVENAVRAEREADPSRSHSVEEADRRHREKQAV